MIKVFNKLVCIPKQSSNVIVMSMKSFRFHMLMQFKIKTCKNFKTFVFLAFRSVENVEMYKRGFNVLLQKV